MVIVNLSLKRSEVKELLLSLDLPGHQFDFVKEKGIKFCFTNSIGNEFDAANQIKKLLKEKLGDGYYYQVIVEETK